MGTNVADSVQVFVFEERKEAGMSGNGSSMWSYSWELFSSLREQCVFHH